MTDEKKKELQSAVMSKSQILVTLDDPIFSVIEMNEIVLNEFLEKLATLYDHQASRVEEQNKAEFDRIWNYAETHFKSKVIQTVKDLDERYSQEPKHNPQPVEAVPNLTQKIKKNDRTWTRILLRKPVEAVAIIVSIFVLGVAMGRFVF
jgi:hypothetical protein